MKNLWYITKRFMFYLFVCLYSFAQVSFAENASIYQTNLNLIDRISKLEEGQKAIVIEMRTRFKAVDARFEMLEKSIDKRFEAIDKRFEMLEKSIDKRFEMLEKSIVKRFEAIDKRFDSLENQYNSQGNINLAMLASIIALIAYVIWDRKTAFNKAFSEVSQKIEQLVQSHLEKMNISESIANKEDEEHEEEKNSIVVDSHVDKSNFIVPKHIQEKFHELINFMNQFPEMRPVLRTV